MDFAWKRCYVARVMVKSDKQDVLSVGFIALGCPKNMVDSEKMLAHIGQAGFVLSSELNNADIVVINTCGFIKPARDEAVEAIKEAVNLKKNGSVSKVIVAGCLAQRMGEELAGEIDGIDAIIGLDQRDNIAEVIRQTMLGKNDLAQTYLQPQGSSVSDDRGRLLISPPHWAYLRISEGCNRKCSFCTIPSIRGPFRSKPEELILSEAGELTGNGAVELSIIAQDSNFYGRDLKIENGLSKLLKRLEQIDPLRWIRLMYLYPTGIDDRLIETIASSEKVLNYIDMPIQHINNDILKSMHRNDRKEKTIALIEKLRSAMPDVVLRTTIIVGYPGETDEQSAELVDFVKWAKFDALGCFTFYPELGTGAAALAGQVPDEIKTARAEELMLTQQQIAFEKASGRIGDEIVCLVDEFDDQRNALGRFYGQAPHIDSVCLINNCSAQPGEFIRAKVTGTRDYDLIVDQIND